MILHGVDDVGNLFPHDQPVPKGGNVTDPSTAQRKTWAKMKWALPDGSFYVRPGAFAAQDVHNAILSVGRGVAGGADGNMIRKHIMARAQLTGQQKQIPDTWNADGSLKQSATGNGDFLSHAKDPSTAQRKLWAKMGIAMPDGSYYIRPGAEGPGDLQNAIDSVGRGENAGDSGDAIRQHIMKRAKALNLSSKIPASWNPDGSLKQSSLAEIGGAFLAHYGVLGMHWGVRSATSDSEEGSPSGRAQRQVTKTQQKVAALNAKADEHERIARGHAAAAQSLQKDHEDLLRNGVNSAPIKRLYGEDVSTQTDRQFYAKNLQSRAQALARTDNDLRLLNNQYVKAANRHAAKAAELRAKAASAQHGDLDDDFDSSLFHYGVQGMRWGHHDDRQIPPGQQGDQRPHLAALSLQAQQEHAVQQAQLSTQIQQAEQAHAAQMAQLSKTSGVPVSQLVASSSAASPATTASTATAPSVSAKVSVAKTTAAAAVKAHQAHIAHLQHLKHLAHLAHVKAQAVLAAKMKTAKTKAVAPATATAKKVPTVGAGGIRAVAHSGIIDSLTHWDGHDGLKGPSLQAQAQDAHDAHVAHMAHLATQLYAANQERTEVPAYATGQQLRTLRNDRLAHVQHLKVLMREAHASHLARLSRLAKLASGQQKTAIQQFASSTPGIIQAALSTQHADSEEEFVAHYGVLGMHWGVRNGSSSVDNASGAGSRGRRRVSEDAATVAGHRAVVKKHGTSALSNDELSELVNRLSLEKRYTDLEPAKTNAGKKFVKDVVVSVGKQQATSYGNKAASAGIEAAIKTATKGKAA